MSWWNEATNALTFHGDPGRFSLQQKWSDMPGSPVSLMHAIAANQWKNPYGADPNSMDRFAGGGSAEWPWARDIGRTVGTLFGLWGLGELGGLGGAGGSGNASAGSSIGGSAGGTSSILSGGGASGNASAPTSTEGGSSLASYLQKYGRQGMNLASQLNQPGTPQGGIRNPQPLIEPATSKDPFAEEKPNDLQPLLLAMLLANMRSQEPSSGSVI